MSRFDEFRDSLEEANESFNRAVDYLTDDDFDSEEDRYCYTYHALSTGFLALQSAAEDVSDDVGIRCELDALKELIKEVEFLEVQARGDSRNCDEDYDEWHARKYVRSIRALQNGLDEIIRTSW